MSLIFKHPVAGFSNAAGAAVAGIVANTSYVTSGGRFTGTGTFKCVDSATTMYINHTAASGKSYHQFAFKWETLPTTVGDWLKLYNNSGADLCLELQVTSAGALRLEDATSATVVTTGAGVVKVGVWQVLCIEAQIGSGAGTVRVWVDDLLGTPVIDETGVDLDDGGGTGCDKALFALTGGSNGGIWYVSGTIYIYDTSGSSWNAPIGDKRDYILLPTSDVVQEFTRSAGGDNYALVDDPMSGNHDIDATYVEASAAPTVDQYGHGGLTGSISGIINVSVEITAKKTDAGSEPGDLKARVTHGGNVTDVAWGTISTSYQALQAHFPNVPAGTGWTQAQVDAALFGPRVDPAA